MSTPNPDPTPSPDPPTWSHLPGDPIPLADDPIPVAPAPAPPPPPPAVAPETNQCPRCGYDVRGLRRPRCPECGTVLTRGELRRIRNEQAVRESLRHAYLRPVLIAAVSAFILGGILVFRYGAAGLPGLVVGLSAGTLAAMVVYLLCGLLFLGFDPPLRLVALQLAAVVAGTSLAYAVFGWFPSMLLAYGIPGFICVLMMHGELDLEIQDAALAGAPTALAIFGAWYFVAHFIL